MKKTCEYLSSLRDPLSNRPKGARNSASERTNRTRNDKCCPPILFRMRGSGGGTSMPAEIGQTARQQSRLHCLPATAPPIEADSGDGQVKAKFRNRAWSRKRLRIAFRVAAIGMLAGIREQRCSKQHTDNSQKGALSFHLDSQPPMTSQSVLRDASRRNGTLGQRKHRGRFSTRLHCHCNVWA
jgi:hypothetical protein